MEISKVTIKFDNSIKIVSQINSTNDSILVSLHGVDGIVFDQEDYAYLRDTIEEAINIISSAIQNPPSQIKNPNVSCSY